MIPQLLEGARAAARMMRASAEDAADGAQAAIVSALACKEPPEFPYTYGLVVARRTLAVERKLRGHRQLDPGTPDRFTFPEEDRARLDRALASLGWSADDVMRQRGRAQNRAIREVARIMRAERRVSA